MKNTKFDKIFLHTFVRSFFLQALWNFERLQNVGFAFVIMPLLKKMYPEKNNRKKHVLRHLEFFNTNPYVSSVVFGFVAAMEESFHEQNGVDEKKITAMKTNIAGPLAAIGDMFFWSTWRPLAVLFAVPFIVVFRDSLSFYGTWFPPILFLLLYNSFILPFRLWSLEVSYTYQKKIIKLLAGMRLKSINDVVRYFGLFCLILLIVFYLSTFGIGLLSVMVLLAFSVFSLVLMKHNCTPIMLLYIITSVCILISFANINIVRIW